MAALFILVLVTLASVSVSGEIVFEDGYTVTTVLDGNKKGINPYSVVPLSPTSSDLLVLDSSGSAFYTLSFLASQEGVIKKYSGYGVAGFSDGELESAMFSKPRSFTIDLKGNVYVADKNNNAIRKISKSGVTTIAGGYSKKPGHTDGPAQNASFSDDFELNFIPGTCALVISDHGNKLIRQINLKAEDCAKDSPSVLGLTSTWLSVLALGVACLFGILAGFFIRPYVASHEGSSLLHYRETWKHFLINLGRRAVTLCFDIRSAIANSRLFEFLYRLIILSLSHVLILFRYNKPFLLKRASKAGQRPVSLIDDSNINYGTITKSDKYLDQLKDLVSFDGEMESSDAVSKLLEGKKTEEVNYNLCRTGGKMEKMIYGNLMNFEQQKELVPLGKQEVGNNIMGLVKRNERKGEKLL